MHMPNFLVIGAAKSGTTALYRYLNEHPQVYMSPVKETNFFALEGERLDFRGPRDREVLERSVNVSSVTGLEAYRGLFGGVSGEKAIGEASPLYLYSPKAPGRIRRYVPEAKLVAVLRDPVERAYSGFLMMRACGREPIADFASALREEGRRAKDNWEHSWHYKRMGFYHAQLKRYYDAFDRGQIRVYLHEDLDADTLGTLQNLFGFLGVDGTFVPDISVRHNASGARENGALPVSPAELNPRNAGLEERDLPGPQPPPEVRSSLAAEYREDILKLQDLVRRDLSGWMQ
ncbi:MAG: sulfotransferase [Actinobacteria bacterium]|nr:MAG: sulfotransferase [Actinomycetota bacterium]